MSLAGLVLFALVGCRGEQGPQGPPGPRGEQGDPGDPGEDAGAEAPADVYFALAVTDDSLNHTGDTRLFLDFADPDTGAFDAGPANRVVRAARVEPDALFLDGDLSDWEGLELTTVVGVPQNNYPLSTWADAVPTDLLVGAAWDEGYVHFAVRWTDAGHTRSDAYRRWVFGDQGNGESAWNPAVYGGCTPGSPNASVVNCGDAFIGRQDEDRLALMFPIADGEGAFADRGLGCGAYCHPALSDSQDPAVGRTGALATMSAPAGDRADVWQWKASRSAGADGVDDGWIGETEPLQSGHRPDQGGAWTVPNSDGSGPLWMHWSGYGATGPLWHYDTVPAGVPNDGDEVPADVYVGAYGSRSDVWAASTWDEATHTWTVELRRARNTGSADDHAFVAGADAEPPMVAAATAPDATAGEGLYGVICEGCHGADGLGEWDTESQTWFFPRVQRTTQGAIQQAAENVSPMGGISLDDDEAADIAAFLQTRFTAAPD